MRFEIEVEKTDDGYTAVIEDWFDRTGYGDTIYEAILSAIEQCEDAFGECEAD